MKIPAKGSVIRSLMSMYSAMRAETERPEIIQDQLLLKLLWKAEKTDFGIYHNFNKISRSADPQKEFSERVPITEYDSFNETWLSRARLGENDVTWPGRILKFSTSSVSPDGAKSLPLTAELLRGIKKTATDQLLTLPAYKLPASFFERKYLFFRLRNYSGG